MTWKRKCIREIFSGGIDYNTLKPVEQMTDKELLKLFREDLDGLSDKVIVRHLEHVDDFINHYLLREVSRPIYDGDEVIGLCLGDYCIWTGVCDTPDTLREMEASLKKFYKSLDRCGKTSEEDVKNICAIIKEELTEWQEFFRGFFYVSSLGSVRWKPCSLEQIMLLQDPLIVITQVLRYLISIRRSVIRSFRSPQRFSKDVTEGSQYGIVLYAF